MLLSTTTTERIWIESYQAGHAEILMLTEEGTWRDCTHHSLDEQNRSRADIKEFEDLAEASLYVAESTALHQIFDRLRIVRLGSDCWGLAQHWVP